MRTLPLLLLAGATFLATGLRAAPAQVSISVDTSKPGAMIAPGFSGLSFETALLLPDDEGRHYFRPDNRALLALFHTLGIKSLRIGGNTGDRDAKKLPGEADLDSFFAFAKAADVKVIYCLQLHNGNAQADAQTAKYIMDRYSDEMECFSIGQEPSAYPKPYSYSDYARDWRQFAKVIIADVPNVKFSGPGVHNNATWARDFMTDFGKTNHVSLITEHLYAGGAGNKVKSPESGRDRMLSDEFTRKYQKLHDGFVPMADSYGLPYRLEEANNYFNGGAKDVSNTFASALWGLDFLYWWAAHGAAGINFHSGDKVAAGYTLRPSKYTAFYSTTNGYNVRPLGYGIKAFDLGSHGALIPLTLSNPDKLNLSAYAVLANDKTLCLTIINKEHGARGRNAKIFLVESGEHFTRGEVIYLATPGNDVAATRGETLGGAVIQQDGNWSGSWKPLDSISSLEVPAASAVVIRLTTN